MDHNRTKSALLEGSVFKVWPQANARQTKNFLLHYCGMSTKGALNVVNMRTRSVTIFKTFPMVLMTDNEIMLLSEKDPEAKRTIRSSADI